MTQELYTHVDVNTKYSDIRGYSLVRADSHVFIVPMFQATGTDGWAVQTVVISVWHPQPNSV